METKHPEQLAPYLMESQYIDISHESIQQQAKCLAEGLKRDVDIAHRTFLFVRDEIDHSWDAQRNPVTCKASDVLLHKTGFCYAKSHLLAALMRANNIPAGICYQRLTITPGTPPFCLHGLNAIWLHDFGWYRMDARGNKEGVSAQYDPPNEKLAFAIEIDGEKDLPEIWVEPILPVISALTQFQDVLALADNLPDIEVTRA